jgi:hypothetical protein
MKPREALSDEATSKRCAHQEIWAVRVAVIFLLCGRAKDGPHSYATRSKQQRARVVDCPYRSSLENRATGDRYNRPATHLKQRRGRYGDFHRQQNTAECQSGKAEHRVVGNQFGGFLLAAGSLRSHRRSTAITIVGPPPIYHLPRPPSAGRARRSASSLATSRAKSRLRCSCAEARPSRTDGWRSGWR